MDGEVGILYPKLPMKLSNSKRGSLAAAILVAFCCAWYLTAHSQMSSMSKLSELVGFHFPEGTIVVDCTRDSALFDSSYSWIVEMPSNQPRPWQSSLTFHECLPTESPNDDYHHIVGLAEDYFPKMAACFKAAKAWRGGKEGNCYILEAESGHFVFCHYFST